MESIKLSSSGQLCCWIKNDSRKKSKSDDAETLISDGFHRRRQKDRKFLIEQAIPPILAIGLYSNSLGGDFVHDDLSAITSNPDVTGYHPEEGTSWDTSLLDPRSHKSYRPFTVLTFRLVDYSLYLKRYKITKNYNQVELLLERTESLELSRSERPPSRLRLLAFARVALPQMFPPL